LNYKNGKQNKKKINNNKKIYTVICIEEIAEVLEII